MAETLGDLKISILLDILDAEKNSVKFGGSLKDTEVQAAKTTKAVDNLEVSTGKLGKGLKTTTKGLSAVLSTTVSLAGSVAVLSGAISDQGGAFDETTEKVKSYGMGLIGLGSTIANLKYLFPSLSVGMLGTAGAVSTLAIGVSAVAGAFGLMTANMRYAIDLFKSGGTLWDFMTTGILNKSGKVLPGPDLEGPLKIKSLDERVKEITDKSIPTIDVVSSGPPKVKSTGRGPAMVKAEKEIKLLSDNFMGFVLFDAAKNVNNLIAHGKLADILPGTVPGQTDLEKLAEKTRYQPRAYEQIEEPGIKFKDAMTSSLDLANEFSSVLNLSADNFVSKFLGGLNQGISLISSLSNFVSMFTGGIGGGLFSMLGFSSGSSAYGGGMSTDVINNLNYSRAREVPYILTTEVSGTSLKTVLRRVDYLDRRSTY